MFLNKHVVSIKKAILKNIFNRQKFNLKNSNLKYFLNTLKTLLNIANSK